MKAITLIDKWSKDKNTEQSDNIDALKKYISHLKSKRPLVVWLGTGERGLESEKIKLQYVYQFKKDIAENVILIEKPEDETDQSNLLALFLYRNPVSFYYCCLAYDGKINPRIISKEVSELELPLELEGSRVKDNDILLLFLDDDKSKIDHLLDGLCKQSKMRDILTANPPKIFVLILMKTPSNKE